VVSPPDATQEQVFSGKEMSGIMQTVNALVLSAILGGAALFVWIMSSLPRLDGTIPVPGLNLPVQVKRDNVGIALITARTQHDAYFSLGWVHAQDRLWQMEWQRRIGAGRLAELVGPAALPSDRFMRTLGLYRLAEQSLDHLDKPVREALSAYAEGVNSWIDNHRTRIPPEYRLVGASPEPWREADSLVWARMMALQLANNWQDDLLRTKLSSVLSPKQLGDLWPDSDKNAPATISAAAAEQMLAATPDTARPRQASNIWAVSGSHTASGKPLLANDPHLGFQVPGVWYLAGIEAPGLTISGGTVPGIPFHLIGHNGRVAWGLTATQADTVELETYAGDPLEITVRTEIIKVKDGASETLNVRDTPVGPIISDLMAVLGPPVVFRSTALEKDDLTPQAFFHMSRVVNWSGFSKALQDFHAPVMNVGYADTQGTIAFMTAGRIPARFEKGGWEGWVPFDELPVSVNPGSGIIVNANNKVVPDTYPHRIARHWPDPSRASRIGHLLNDRAGLTSRDMTAIQMDALSLPAVRIKTRLGEAKGLSAKAQWAAQAVADWDGHMAADRAEPLIFWAWAEQVWEMALSDELGSTFAAFRQVKPDVLVGILAPGSAWCDDTRTEARESCDAIVAAGLDKALEKLAARFGHDHHSWQWGRAHRAVFEHPIVAALPLLSDMGRTELATDGDDFTVNRGTFAPGTFRHVHGAGLRAVFDLSNLDRSTFVAAIGQSGNPMSRHYDDMAHAWAQGRTFTPGKHAEYEASLELIPSY
jgi:penicillin amidase